MHSVSSAYQIWPTLQPVTSVRLKLHKTILVSFSGWGNSEAKDMENCRFTLLPLRQQLKLFFRIIVSANQLSLYGAVAEMCEEYESLHDRSGRPDTVMGQSIVLSEIKTEVPLDCDDPTNQDLLLQQYEELIEKLSQQDK